MAAEQAIEDVLRLVAHFDFRFHLERCGALPPGTADSWMARLGHTDRVVVDDYLALRCEIAEDFARQLAEGIN